MEIDFPFDVLPFDGQTMFGSPVLENETIDLLSHAVSIHPSPNLLSPMKHHDLYDGSGLPYSDLNGISQPPVINHSIDLISPIKQGFTKIEDASYANIKVKEEKINSWFNGSLLEDITYDSVCDGASVHTDLDLNHNVPDSKISHTDCHGLNCIKQEENRYNDDDIDVKLEPDDVIDVKLEPDDVIDVDDVDITVTLKDWDVDKEADQHHSQEYCCSVCSKSFRRRSALSFHLSLHASDEVDGGQPDSATRNSRLSVKQTEPHKSPAPKKVRNFDCEHCGMRFASITSRGKHLSHCVKAGLAEPVDLSKYIAPSCDGRLKCAMCNKSFNHRSTLRTHIRVHTGEKPCQCRFCGKYYRDHSTLSKHYRVHTNEKPYKCPECSRGFSQSGNMRRHIIHVHKIHLPPDIITRI